MAKGYLNTFGEWIEDPPCPYKLGNVFKHVVSQGEGEFEGYGFTVNGKVIGINAEHHYFRVLYEFGEGRKFVSCYKYPVDVANESRSCYASGANPLGNKLSRLNRASYDISQTHKGKAMMFG